MSPDGDPPPPPPNPPPPPHPPGPPDGRFWSRVWTYWVTGGLAVVLAAVIPVLAKAGPFAPDPDPPPTTAPPTATATPEASRSPAPALSTTTPVRVSAKINSVTPLGAVTPTVTKVQVNVTFAGLKGKSAYIKWHTYNDATKLTMSEDSTISSPVLNWDSTDWKPTFIIPTPSVHWQLQVTAYAPDGTQLATGHSNFTFNSSTGTNS